MLGAVQAFKELLKDCIDDLEINALRYCDGVTDQHNPGEKDKVIRSADFIREIFGLK